MTADRRPARAPLRVLLADAASLQRAGLRAVLTSGGGPAFLETAGQSPFRTDPDAPPRPVDARGDQNPPVDARDDQNRTGIRLPGGPPGSSITRQTNGSTGTPAESSRQAAATNSPAGTPAESFRRVAATHSQAGTPAESSRRAAATHSPAGPTAETTSRAGDGGGTLGGPGERREITGWGDGRREIVVAGEAGDGVEAVDLARRLLPDVLIVDVALPRLDGLAVTRAIAEARLAVPVLILTGAATDDEVAAAITAGAAGYLCKDSPPGELVAAVHAVAAGGAVITPRVLARVLNRLSAELSALTAPAALSRLAPLTAREREVLIEVARGHSNSEIAETLGVGETTVKTHVGHVLTKLRLRDRTQAVILAYETGLIRPRA